jgi:hypothetical protein
MEHPTYHQLLAEVYDESSKNLLVHHNEYEDEEISPEDHHPDEIEDQEEFQKQQSSHQEAALGNSPNLYKDTTKLSVLYSKDVKIHVINVDSKFRYIDPKVQSSISTSSNFTFKFKDVIKNVISMKVSGVEIPNSMYVFHDNKQNLKFDITVGTTKHTVSVPEGNYEDVCSLITIIQEKLNTLYPESNFVLNVDDISAKLTITSSDVFSLTFTGKSASLYGNGMGYHLGFKNVSYAGASTYVGETLVNTIESNYIFLSLGPNYPVIDHRCNNTDLAMFAKILVNVPKNAVIFDNGTNVITKEYFFKQPTNMTSVPVQVFDLYGELVDLQGLNFSFTLEMTEITNHGLYKLFNEVSS